MALASQCHDLALLQQYLLGTLPDAEATGLEKHLLDCDRCARALNQLAEQDSLLVPLQAPAAGDTQPINEAAVEDLIRRLAGQSPTQVSSAAALAATELPGSTLGDYRLLRELGRGGMGVVYEAEQISLNRRVALKVLPFAATLDERQLLRFKNEALAAAALDHPHIVEVHGVGCERAVHFFAMRMIDGVTLAEVIAGLRKNHEARMANAKGSAKDNAPMPEEAAAEETKAEIRHSTLDVLSSFGIRHAAFFRKIAELGQHIAEALDHAHQQGIIHRDIKPSNLMLDSRGKVWITDFGLAHVQNEKSLTMTGDLLGTLRYMSPEQALAKRVVVDHRTDIYSLGMTLYELLTLEPAFGGRDRQELLRQIAFEEPRPPRRVNPAIPAELETIVLKAMEKNPADRYATAEGLADDLRRYLEDQPIRARRPTLVQRAEKWVRRHQAISWVGIAALAVLTVGSTISAGIIARQRDLAEQRRQDAEHERSAAQQAEKQANAERDRARRAEAKADAISEFLVQNILTFSPPGWFGFPPSDTTVAEALEGAAHDVENAFRGQPELEASVRLTIGNSFFRMGKYKEAAEHLGKGLSLRGDLYLDSADPWSRESAETAFATKSLGRALQALGKQADAKPFLLRGGEARRRVEIRQIPFQVKASPFTLHPWYVVLSPDSRWILAAGDDDLLRLYDVATGVEIHRFSGHSAGGLAFFPDGRHLISGHHDKTLRLWDVFAGKELRQFTGHAGPVHFAAVSPGGQYALSAGSDKTIRLWDVDTGKEIRQFLGHTDLIRNAAFSPDGRRMLSASNDGTIRLWDVETGMQIRSFAKSWNAVGSVVFSPDGQQALSTHDDYSRLWDVATGAELRRIRNADGIKPVDFIPNGCHAVGSGDQTGKWYLFDVYTGKEVRTYHVEPPLRPKNLLVSRDGRLAVCGNYRGSISIWRLGDPPPMGQELAAARQCYEEKRRELGPDRADTLQALDSLAALHLDREEPADAEPLFRESLECKLRIFGEEHPATMASMKNLARVLKQQKKLADAEKLLRQCMEIYRRVQGPEHLDVIVSTDELADILEAQGKRDEADDLWAQCVQGWETLLGYDHSETRAAASKLVFKLQAHGKPPGPKALGRAVGCIYAQMGQWDKALPCLARLFESDLPKDQGLCLDYACLLVQARDTDGYRKLCTRLLERFVQEKNSDDIDTLAHTLVLAPQALPDSGPILELAQRRKARVTPGSPHYLWSNHVLALAYYRAGRLANAKECLSGNLSARPAADNDVANCLLQALIDLHLGNEEKAKDWVHKADQWIEAQAPKIGQWEYLITNRLAYWRHWVMIQLLRREVEAVLSSKSGQSPTQTKAAARKEP